MAKSLCVLLITLYCLVKPGSSIQQGNALDREKMSREATGTVIEGAGSDDNVAGTSKAQKRARDGNNF